MFKLQVSLGSLYEAGLLKVVLQKINLDNVPENAHLIIAKDWANNSLPEKYKNFKPDLKQIVELSLPDQYLISGFTKWIEENNTNLFHNIDRRSICRSIK